MDFAVRAIAFVIAIAGAGCQREQPLTAEKASEIIKSYQFRREPIYAEVPQRVWWSPKSPKDDFDEKALRTLRNLERAGFVTVTESNADDGTVSYQAKVTQKGFPLLGTSPSMRGPAYRARIAEKRYDGLRNFVRHPSEPTVGSAELVWHYENPTQFYDLFETKINKPLNRPFASLVSFYFKDHQWRFSVTVPKTDTSAE
ncbi:MAG TPA: hypothetical protein VFL80_02480 [Thermoanaerobaculia bacterium]|nr:hypothetical protein [Thermoanaerobaculia bacterium]